jgi:signal transduction histidine kinase
MAWVIASNRSNSSFALSPRFQILRWQLLGAYLGIMMVINLISNILVYQFFARSLHQQVDQRLQILADSAAHSLEEIQRDNINIKKQAKRHLDYDHDLDLSWQNLQQSDQSIEWFDAQKQLLGRSGKISIASPLSLGFSTLSQSSPIRVLLVPVYNKKHPNKPLIAGYIRVAESTEEVEVILHQLFWGFGIGEVISLILIGVGGMFLTRQSLKPLEKSYQQLKQFTGDASHELRSPLTAIKLSVEVLQTHPERIHSQDVEKLNSIISATNQMGRLVEDLLLLARTDNELDLIHQDQGIIPLEELLEDVITLLEPQAEQKSILITIHCLANGMVQGDTFQLQRLFTNLLENAIKYTPAQGQVDITLQATEKWATITIQDTGIGIDPQQLPFIFDRFWQAEQARSPIPSTTSTQAQGTGLGLAIAQSIVKRHGGEITVKSMLGEGTCFTVRLPVASTFLKADFTLSLTNGQIPPKNDRQ